MKSICSAFARRAAIVVLAAFAAALPHFAAAQSGPLAGTWNFVPARSNFMPGPARYKSATLTFSNSGESQMTIEGVDADGKPVKVTYAASVDGKPHPVAGVPAFDTVTWTRFNDNIATYAYLRRKSNVVLGSRALSPDGNVLTFNEKTYDDKGKQTGTAVMVFAKPGFETASATAPRPAAPAAPIIVPTTTPDEDAGAAALAKDDADGAIAAFTRAIDAKGPIATPLYDHVMRGLAYGRKGMNEQALADFDVAVMLKPDDADARFRRGTTRVELKQYQGAIEDLTVAVQGNPMNAAAFNIRGFAYDALGQYNNGNDDEAKACELSKDFCKK
jgi:tetratricopeptide (TPR) repeat protein